MPFPKKDRIIFTKNPLTDVICQLRFPSILKIDTEVPAKFQDKIRDVFPNFTESSAIITPAIEYVNFMRHKQPLDA